MRDSGRGITMRCIGVIDDNDVTQQFFIDLFTAQGWDVVPWHGVDEVHEAIQSLEDKQPDVIVLDLHLGERNAGLEALRDLKANSKTRDVPIIMTSGDVWALQSLPEEVRQDVAAVLVKPFELDEAYGAVEYAIEQAPSQGSTSGKK
jgi:CheY-like chemotaxis protein